MKIKTILSILLVSIVFNHLFSQNRNDYNWIMGYDQDIYNQIIQIDFNNCNPNILQTKTFPGFGMEGSNTSMSDKNGNLLFYSSGCYIVNNNGEIMQNGDSINLGLIQDIWCSAGSSPTTQGVISIPAPESDSLYYVFNLDMLDSYFLVDTFIGIVPEHLYYQLIDMSENAGKGKVILKNQIAIQDTFARGNIQATRHANGIDWWIITPKSHTNCYFLNLVTAQGVQPSVLKCEGKIWNDLDLAAQSVFSPDGSIYSRFDKNNGLNIYNFDNQTGDLYNHKLIEFPNDTFTHGGVSISLNSRFLYASAWKKIY
jgi:hypothetical protein